VSDQNDSIFREIDEEVRRDRLLALWKRYGVYAVGTLLLLVAGAFGYQFWQDYRDSQLAEASESYEQVVERAGEMEPVEAAKAFADAAERLEGGYGLLARLRQAGALSESGEIARAGELYESIAERADDRRLRAYARYLAASAKLETDGPDAAIAMLGPLADPTAPLYHSALELLAVAHLRAGDEEQAKSQFASLAEDPETPQALKGRAEEMLTMLGAEDAVDDAAPATPQAMGRTGRMPPQQGASQGKADPPQSEGSQP